MQALLSFDFAYSRGMQWILFFVSCATSFLFYSLVTNIILKLYGQVVPLKRRLQFVTLVSLVMNSLWTYGIYLIGGMAHFPPIVYALVTIPNPFFAMLIYLCGVKVMRLSPYRSLRVIENAYMYYIGIKTFLRFTGALLFAQPGGAYNYLLDAVSLLFGALFVAAVYGLTMAIINRNRFVIHLTDQLFITSLRRALVYSFIKACCVYGFVIIMPILDPDIYVNLFTGVILMLWLNLTILGDNHKAMSSDISNKETHINNLVESINRFRGAKHDMNNMLLAYEGFIELNDMQSLKAYHRSVTQQNSQVSDRLALNQHMAENPALVSVINAKLDYAEREAVRLELSISCGLDLYIDNLDACRSVACLLDNAIEAASLSPEGVAMLSIEQKPDNTKLVIIKNSTMNTVDTSELVLGKSTKPGHSGIGLHQVRKTLGKYGNCAFHLSSYDHSFTAYMAIMPLSQ